MAAIEELQLLPGVDMCSVTAAEVKITWGMIEDWLSTDYERMRRAAQARTFKNLRAMLATTSASGHS